MMALRLLLGLLLVCGATAKKVEVEVNADGSATVGGVEQSGEVAEENANEGGIRAILEELKATEALIAAQQQKVEVLSSLRDAFLSGAKVPADFDVDALKAARPHARLPAAAPVRQAMPAVVRGEFDDYMVLRSEIDVAQGMSCVMMASLKTQKNMFAGGKRRKKEGGKAHWREFKKTRLSRQQYDSLERVFAATRYPSKEQLDSLFELTRLPRRTATDWFMERRKEEARVKRKVAAGRVPTIRRVGRDKAPSAEEERRAQRSVEEW